MDFDFSIPELPTLSPASKEDEALKEFAEAIKRAKEEEEAATKAIEAQEAEVSLYNSEVAALERKLLELKKQQTAAKGALWNARKPLREAKEKVAAAESNFAVQKSTIEDRREMALKSEGYGRIAKQFEWYTGLNGNPNLKALPHQWDGIRYLATAKRAILGDGMGVGKTLTAIGAMDVSEAKRILIVAPSDITTNFLAEIEMWANHRTVFNLRGRNKVERDAFLSMANFLPSYIAIINYESWRKDNTLLRDLVNCHFDTIVMDEAHIAKETDTVTYRGLSYLIEAINHCPVCDTNIKVTFKEHYIRGVKQVYDVFKCGSCGWAGESWAPDGISPEELHAQPRTIKRVWPMTGTPILNRPQDLYALLSLIDPINFDNKNRFLREYAEMDPYTGKWGFRSGGLGSLMKRLSGKFLARSMDDAGITLPPQKPIRHEVSLERYEKQQWVINQITKHAALMLDENRKMSIPAIIALITRQRQANVWPGGIELKDENGEVVWRVAEDITESAKIDKALELIRNFTAQGDRVVVFSQFSTALREMGDRIDGMLNDNGDEVTSVVFDGKTPEDIRGQIKTNFDRKMREPKKWDVVLANYKTGGTGLNLTAATQTIILDVEWNGGKEDQALARTLRIGQTEETFVHYLSIPGTIDDWMDDLIQAKRDLVAGFNDSAIDLREELLKKINGGK